MKKATLLILSTIFVLLAGAQTFSWQWAERGVNYDSSANKYVEPSFITTDAKGNVIVMGDFKADSVSFGAYTLYNHSDSGDVYIVKYDAAGNVLWAKSGRGNLFQWAYGVMVDKYGFIYVTGQFSSAYLIFGDDSIHQTPGVTCGECDPLTDGFIVKYSPDGNVIWLKDFGGSNYDQLYQPVADTLGNLFLTGGFGSDEVIFGGDTLRDATHSNYINTVLLKCDTSGQVIWARSSPWGASGNAVLDPSGNIILNGEFYGSSSITFGSITVHSIGNVVLTGANPNFFIVKYDVNGNALWAQNTGMTTWYSTVAGMSSDPMGNTFLTGTYTDDSVNIGAQTLYGNDSTNHFFITKYDTGGHVLWVHGATGQGIGVATATDANGDTWVAGSFYTPSIAFGNAVLYNSDSATSDEAIFIVEYDSAGNVINDMALGGNLTNSASYFTMDPVGNLYLTGYTTSDSIAFGSVVLNCSGDTNTTPFVAKYAVTGFPSAIPAIRDDNGVVVFPNPSSNQWTVLVSSNLLGSTAILYDVNGKMIYKTEISDLNTQLNVPVASGVYLLTITSGDTRVVRRVVRL